MVIECPDCGIERVTDKNIKARLSAHHTCYSAGQGAKIKVFKMIQLPIKVEVSITGLERSLGINLHECPKCQAPFWADGDNGKTETEV